MADVVDSDELLRRIQRARACAAREERALRSGDDPGAGGGSGSGDTEARRVAYEVVLRVLDEILTPGRRGVRD
ncbi:hypothetical protein [Streptomyces sp. bgisy022]|uniref:hypothetical protein n=1 Tax=Streptomyces sp. bgisy022 TaxID=3413769 RepID=UPI003D705047